MSDPYDVAGVGPGFDEAEGSSLPGLHDGPGDAYRHILGAAELTRRHGEVAARAMLEAHEIKGRLIDPRPIRPIPNAGIVHVQAHARDGGAVHVDAHHRAPPSQ